jgi:deoxyribonuclease-4
MISVLDSAWLQCLPNSTLLSVVEWLKLLACTRLKAELGGRKDRHEHIGAGHIGRDGLAALLTTPEFGAIDWILETEPEGRASDITEIKAIRNSENT